MRVTLEHLYRWPDTAPRWVVDLDDRFAYQFNRLVYAITDAKRDLTRLDEKMGR